MKVLTRDELREAISKAEPITKMTVAFDDGERKTATIFVLSSGAAGVKVEEATGGGVQYLKLGEFLSRVPKIVIQKEAQKLDEWGVIRHAKEIQAIQNALR